MSSRLTVATANVLRSLTRSDARAVLRTVLDHGPDLVGLQEWGLSRWRLLAETGAVRPVPLTTATTTSGYLWAAPVLGGCPVGARAERFEMLRTRSVLLSLPGRSDNPARPLGLEPPRLATVVGLRERSTGHSVSLICYHLVPGAESRGRYRADRPVLAVRHQREVAALQRLVDQERARGAEVYAVGDSNFDGLRIDGLASSWQDRERPGTLGHRTIDDVHGPGPASEVRLVATASDHKAVVAAWQ